MPAASEMPGSQRIVLQRTNGLAWPLRRRRIPRSIHRRSLCSPMGSGPSSWRPAPTRYWVSSHGCGSTRRACSPCPTSPRSFGMGTRCCTALSVQRSLDSCSRRSRAGQVRAALREPRYSARRALARRSIGIRRRHRAAPGTRCGLRTCLYPGARWPSRPTAASSTQPQLALAPRACRYLAHGRRLPVRADARRCAARAHNVARGDRYCLAAGHRHRWSHRSCIYRERAARPRTGSGHPQQPWADGIVIVR